MRSLLHSSPDPNVWAATCTYLHRAPRVPDVNLTLHLLLVAGCLWPVCYPQGQQLSHSLSFRNMAWCWAANTPAVCHVLAYSLQPRTRSMCISSQQSPATEAIQVRHQCGTPAVPWVQNLEAVPCINLRPCNCQRPERSAPLCRLHAGSRSDPVAFPTGDIRHSPDRYNITTHETQHYNSTHNITSNRGSFLTSGAGLRSMGMITAIHYCTAVLEIKRKQGSHI